MLVWAGVWLCIGLVGLFSWLVPILTGEKGLQSCPFLPASLYPRTFFSWIPGTLRSSKLFTFHCLQPPECCASQVAARFSQPCVVQRNSLSSPGWAGRGWQSMVVTQCQARQVWQMGRSEEGGPGKASFFFLSFIFLLLFVCAYKAWFISPPCPHPLPYHPLHPTPAPPAQYPAETILPLFLILL
jgi:hypothetical protein